MYTVRQTAQSIIRVNGNQHPAAGQFLQFCLKLAGQLVRQAVHCLRVGQQHMPDLRFLRRLWFRFRKQRGRLGPRSAGAKKYCGADHRNPSPSFHSSPPLSPRPVLPRRLILLFFEDSNKALRGIEPHLLPNLCHRQLRPV